MIVVILVLLDVAITTNTARSNLPILSAPTNPVHALFCTTITITITITTTAGSCDAHVCLEVPLSMRARPRNVAGGERVGGAAVGGDLEGSGQIKPVEFA